MNWGALSGHQAVADEQLRMIWSHARLGVFVATAFAFALGVTLRGVVAPFALVDTWLAAKLAIALFRWMQGWQFRQAPSTDHGWGYLTLTALIVDAAIWGAAGLYTAISAPWPVASFVIAALACISCVATFGLQASARYTAAYSTPILAPTALGMLMRGEALGQLGGLGLLMLLGLQVATAVRSERRVRETIRLRIQAEDLAKEKEEALKTAMRQSAVKTQFLANMSHELRTPLHGILGMARLLHMDLQEPLLARRVELIQSSGTHLLGLINDLLDISRIEAGQFILRNERYDLRVQVEQLVGVYAVRAEDKGLFFDVHHQLPAQCWVMGDPARFRQVLHNLLGNAIKFTQCGGIVLTIERDDERGLVRAEVRDTGVGIAPQDIDNIFKAFQQSDSGTSASSTEGVGLGLTIARDIARAMGGDITADSQEGVGSTMVFTARLPSVQTTNHAPQHALHQARTLTPNRSQTQPSASPTRPCLVLMAEDNDVNALVASNYLDVIGTDTERVKDGRDAVRHALRETNRPDIVLMDCHMPVMNGYEATRMIRAQETKLGLTHIPIIALTATASDAERQDCLDAGMDDFLSKPCSLEEMTAMLQRWTSSAVTPPDVGARPSAVAPVESAASPGASFQT
ncbi:MAG: response regulator [Burkholderiales bacterium]|nr:response regulator [Burkholderiales bacterium]